MVVLASAAVALRIGIAACSAAAVGVLVLAVAVVLSKRERRIERRLSGYAAHPVLAASRPDLFDLSKESAMVARAVELTRGLALRIGALSAVERRLEQADVPLRAAEVLFYEAVAMLATFVLGAIGFGVTTALLLTATMALLPVVIVGRRRSSRLTAFQGQLPDTLKLFAGSMRAGFSFVQGLEAVAEESSEPMRRELQRVFTEARLGRSLEDSLQDCAERMDSHDLAWVVIALRIQREVGGNLAELLDTVAETMTERERLRREVRSLTAEGRFSAIVLTVMPLFFLGLFQVLQPDYVPRLFDEMIGIVAAIGSLVGVGVGWLWLRRITNIEV